MTEWLKGVPAAWIIVGFVGNAAITWWQTRQHSDALKDHESRISDLEKDQAYQKGLRDGHA